MVPATSCLVLKSHNNFCYVHLRCLIRLVSDKQCKEGKMVLMAGSLRLGGGSSAHLCCALKFSSLTAENRELHLPSAGSSAHKFIVTPTVALWKFRQSWGLGNKFAVQSGSVCAVHGSDRLKFFFSSEIVKHLNHHGNHLRGLLQPSVTMLFGHRLFMCSAWF